jgi:phosphatidylglycerophosphate synthase
MIDYLNKKSQEWRAIIYQPILQFLTALKIKANTITNFRLILGLVFLYVFTLNPKIASLLLLLTIFLDSFDGSLARYQNTQSDRGKFLDVVVDHAIYVLMLFSFISLGVNGLNVAINIWIVGMSYFLAVIYKQENKSSDWIIKPYPKLSYLRLINVLVFYLFIWFEKDWLDQGLLISNLLATFLSLYYWIRIQKRWNKSAISC